MIHDPIEEIWLYQSPVATSRNTTLKNKDHGGAILASHGTSEKESGQKSTRNSGNLPDTQLVIAQRPAKSDDQVQSRVRFNVKNSVETCEPDAWVKQDRHHTVRTNGVGKTERHYIERRRQTCQDIKARTCGLFTVTKRRWA